MTLSPRQRQIIRLIASGATAKEIADKCDLREVTVRFHLRAAMRRLRAKTPAHAVFLWLQP